MEYTVAKIVFTCGSKDAAGTPIYRNGADAIVRGISANIKKELSCKSKSLIGIFYVGEKQYPEFGDDIVYKINYEFDSFEAFKECLTLMKLSSYLEGKLSSGNICNISYEKCGK